LVILKAYIVFKDPGQEHFNQAKLFSSPREISSLKINLPSDLSS